MSTNKKPKIFSIYCDVYGTNLLVILGMKPEKVRPYIEKKYKIEWHYGDELKGGAQFDFDKWPYHVIWLNDKCLNKSDLIPKISHEVLHLVLKIAVDKGLPTYPMIDNLIMDEPIGYLMEFYMRQILKNL